ncbi:glycosyltransferase family 4 protein [Patescibacteria group bacterium]|nr:glycosyltransferase family 4 protein [Patescibacteria group bacterium]MBU4431493.1 glycosyltransferase family 4 protein [Patescibacteria group bacterium]MBU4578890.1 glycosyltransferase family 4 protein [Patescibacteria group bacterium]MCG2702169.1 glycosyltransferase family 4 protein [Candidatus Parcubacteria bacterium]
MSCSSIYKSLKSNKYDIVHVHNMLPMFILSTFRKTIDSKVVFTFHNTPDPPNRILGYFKNFFLDKSFAEFIIKNNNYDLLIPGSKFYYDWAVKLGANPEKTKLIYMGIEKEVFDSKLRQNKAMYRKKIGLPSSDFIVTFPSRIIRRKGIFELINAFSLLKKSGCNNIKLFLPASFSPFDSGCYEEISHLIKKLGLDGIILKPNKLFSYYDMPMVYGASDLVVMPSYYEGLGLAALESMSMGIPVIATNVVGLNEIFENNKNGLLIKRQSVEELYTAIKTIYINPKLYHRLSMGGKQTINNKFEIKNQVNKLEKVYTQLINEQ